jgi:hypothetical protein
MVIAQSDKEIITAGTRKRRLSRNRARIFKTSDFCFPRDAWEKLSNRGCGKIGYKRLNGDDYSPERRIPQGKIS